ncbi:hypothetical protein ACPPVT_08705 [Angustibacter sp. McL0619]|uniref:hypothetical protein n=1 Tax=Angustibacter sp. McL0619 TaxID=3415676 RepID=UPI003CE97667
MADGTEPSTTPEQPAAKRRRAAAGWWVLAAFSLLAVAGLLLSQLFDGAAPDATSGGRRPTPSGDQSPGTGPTTAPTAGSSVTTGTTTNSDHTTSDPTTVGTTPFPTTTRTTPGTTNPGGTPSTSAGPTATPSGSGVPFSITSSTTNGQLLPGATRTLSVRVQNPNASAIRLLTLTVSVGNPAQPGCAASWVTVGDYRSARDPLVQIAAGQSRQVKLPITLTNLVAVNQDACKGVVFPLAFNGSAAQVP